MDKNGVCAVVVTFRPDTSVLSNLARVVPQAECVVAVDNGSPAETVHGLRRASRQTNFQLIENGRNLGIATALNIGVKWAVSRSFRWIIVLDQDSCVTRGFVTQMLQDFDNVRSTRNIMLLVPRYRDPHTDIEISLPLADDGGPLVTLTSGSLFPRTAFEFCGYFKDDLFIYTVDDEYSLRMRSKGYSIAQSKRAVLLHSPGSPSHHRLLGIQFCTTNHSAAARYYLNRNRIWLLRTYGLKYPRWSRGILRAFAFEFVKIMLSEKSRLLKAKMIVLGLRDGLAGRMGKTVDL
jgi:rhamnosyltransferase